MEPPPDGTHCHILRLPYEMLKHILAELVQCDQLSIAKTCIHLLEIAYPVAYHHIFIKTDPVTAMTTWKNLASGNGLRHVRHLQVHDSGQSTANARKRHHVGDVVTGILLAALRRHQLLSFSLTHPVVASSMVSTRNLVILMETQQHLAQVSLPSFMRSNDISIANFLPVNLQFRSLRNITLELPISSSVDDMSSVIVEKSPSLESIHLWFSAQGNELSPHVFTVPRGEPSSRGILFSMATRLTILGYDFKHLPKLVGLPLFPALRALAMIDCKNDVYLHVRTKPGRLPKLRALMITSANYIPGDDIIRLIGGTSCLRELIVYGPNLYFVDCSSLRSHAQSLELLFFGIRGTSLSSLEALTALRHLGVSMNDLYYWKSTRFCIESKKRLTKVFANFASHKKLLSLTLRCTIDFLPNEEETSLPLGIGHFEALIRDTLLSYITEMGSTIDDSILEYLGVVVNVTAYTLDLPAKAPEGPNQALERLKKVLCLRPKQVLRLADLAMEDMMARYAKDDYYFLEAYIDTMTKASRVGISSGSKFVAYN